MTEGARGTWWDVLSNVSFRNLWIGQTISNMGDWLDITAISAVVLYKWQMGTGAYALVMMMYSLPWLFVGPIAGVFADRWNRKTTMIVADVVRAAAVAGMVWAPDLTTLMILLVIRGCVATFFAPSRTALVREIMAKEDLLAANSLSNFSLNATKIFGPSVGGLWIAALKNNVAPIFAANALSFLLSGLFICMVPYVPARKAEHMRERKSAVAAFWSFWSEFAQGFSYLTVVPIVFTCTFVYSWFGLASGLTDTLVNVVVRDVYNDARVLGFLVGGVGAGALAGAAAVGAILRNVPLRRLMYTGPAFFGLTVIPLVLMMREAHWLSVVASIAVLSAFLGIAMIVIPTLLQQETQPHILGRVSASFNSLHTLMRLGGCGLAGLFTLYLAPGNALVVVLVSTALLMTTAIALLLRREARLQGLAPALPGAGGEG